MNLLSRKESSTLLSLTAVLFACVITVLYLTGCSFKKQCEADIVADSTTMHKEADSLFVTVEELKRMTPEVKEKRKAAIILSKYVSLKGDTYSLDISKEEAERLGVKGSVYDEICRDVENTNSTIRKLKADGISIDLVDIKEEAEKADSALKMKRN